MILILLSTPYTYYTGLGRQYCIVSLALWWFFHVCSLFWKVVFPVHARGHQHYHKYIHIALVIAGLLLPVPGVIAAFATGGYAIHHFPPLLCAVEDRDTEYYTTWLIWNILLLLGITLLIIITWKVHKVCVHVV